MKPMSMTILYYSMLRPSYHLERSKITGSLLTQALPALTVYCHLFLYYFKILFHTISLLFLSFLPPLLHVRNIILTNLNTPEAACNCPETEGRNEDECRSNSTEILLAPMRITAGQKHFRMFKQSHREVQNMPPTPRLLSVLTYLPSIKRKKKSIK